jgi:hypothetical protein
MKKPFFIWGILFLLAASNNSLAQESSNVDTLIKNLKLDFAVPDLPAFNALESEPGNLLRPSTPKDFSLVLNQFYNGNNIVIPQKIAVEIAPITLLRYNRLTLEDYQKTPVLYNSRISLGTVQDSLSVSKVALGFRTTLINRGDIKNENYLTEIYATLGVLGKSRSDYIDAELERRGISEEEFALDEDLQEELNSNYEDIKMQTDSVENLIKEYQNKNWNAEKLDVAFSIVGTSPDSIVGNIKYNSFSGWATYARPVGENGQLMLGVNLNLAQSEENSITNFTIPVRYYMGTNKLKGFAEGQYKYKKIGDIKSSELLLKLGFEYYLAFGFWADFYAGVYNDLTTNNSRFTSNFRLVYAIPGDFEQ